MQGARRVIDACVPKESVAGCVRDSGFVAYASAGTLYYYNNTSVGNSQHGFSFLDVKKGAKVYFTLNLAAYHGCAGAGRPGACDAVLASWTANGKGEMPWGVGVSVGSANVKEFAQYPGVTVPTNVIAANAYGDVMQLPAGRRRVHTHVEGLDKSIQDPSPTKVIRFAAPARLVKRPAEPLGLALQATSWGVNALGSRAAFVDPCFPGRTGKPWSAGALEGGAWAAATPGRGCS